MQSKGSQKRSNVLSDFPEVFCAVSNCAQSKAQAVQSQAGPTRIPCRCNRMSTHSHNNAGLTIRSVRGTGLIRYRSARPFFARVAGPYRRAVLAIRSVSKATNGMSGTKAVRAAANDG